MKRSIWLSAAGNAMHSNDNSIKGPWTLELPTLVAYSSPRIWQDGKHIASIHYCDDTEQCEANAHLIAAAPQLLESLRACLFFVPIGVAARHMADYAITLATGQEP